MIHSVDFAACGERYIDSPELIVRYNYSGYVKLITPNPQTQITYKGCKAICGTGNDWYPWHDISATLTTWVLPMLGTLLQAPFESNAFWRTVKAIGRWVGSPIATLTYILWNIEVSGKCALFVDMAVPYNAHPPDQDSDYADLRDSFYLLINFNQYKMKPLISMTKEAEGLLRICMFSQDLKLPNTNKTLQQLRRKLAITLRSNRRRGAVPVFISTLWFIFSVAVSIYSAFGDVGNNQQAHNLAMGLFMSWPPILILCSIIDRNPVASDDIRLKLNKIIDHVCDALGDRRVRARFTESFIDMPQAQHMALWVEKISVLAPAIRGDFFTGFAGQARTRFHYGAAHAILLDIEKSYIAERRRGWYSIDPRSARASLVLGQVDSGFVWFDGRQMWQVFSAMFLVLGTSAGAFILSYWTPTVGLGCRSFGYLLFVSVAMFLLITEVMVWYFTSPVRKNEVHALVKEQLRQRQAEVLGEKRKWAFPGVATSKRSLGLVLNATEHAAIATCKVVTCALPRRQRRQAAQRMEKSIRTHFQQLYSLTTRQWLERCILTPLELLNMVFLIYLIFSQALGGFVNCFCQTSLFGPGGGYLDFTQWAVSNNKYVERFWIIGTVVSSVVMGLGMLYVVLEWCLQAHLSTESYRDAQAGLWKVRRFRRFTFWIRYPASLVVLLINKTARLLKLRKTGKRETVIWQRETKHARRIGQSMLRVAMQMGQLPLTLAEAREQSTTTTSPDNTDGQKSVIEIRKQMTHMV